MAQCRKQLYLDGKPSPRRCAVCGLGPCQEGVVTMVPPTPATQAAPLLDELAALAGRANAILDELATMPGPADGLLIAPKVIAKARQTIETGFGPVRKAVEAAQ